MLDGLAGKDESRKVPNRSNVPLKEISFHSSHIPAFTEIESTHVTQQSTFDGSVASNAPSLSTTTSSISRTSSLTQTAPIVSSIIPKVGITESTALDSNFRAVHEISLSALMHNYRIVEAAAANQKCSVIVVTKADGYGHGAVETVLHLANQGADAFAVATLEEAITLRKALCRSSSQKGVSSTTWVQNSSQNPGIQSCGKSQMTPCEPQSIERSSLVSKFHSPIYGDSHPASISNAAASRRAHHIRILVLGPPVGCPDCFDDYYYYSIECMITGPEVAASFLQWARNPLALKRRIVERTAKETKEQLQSTENHLTESGKDTNAIGSSHRTDNLNDNTINVPSKQLATLSGSSGKDLAKEYKQFLQYQQKAATLTSISLSEKAMESTWGVQGKENSDVGTSRGDFKPIDFCGIETVALRSRNREKATASQVWVEDSVSDKETATVANSTSTRHSALKSTEKRLKWHAVIDTGMGRVGFKPELPTSSIERRDTVEIIQELIHAQFHQEAPIGECFFRSMIVGHNQPCEFFTQWNDSRLPHTLHG
jgi:Alanine racemase, N-terminal domain